MRNRLELLDKDLKRKVSDMTKEEKGWIKTSKN
jgi:hypothetical protein